MQKWEENKVFKHWWCPRSHTFVQNTSYFVCISVFTLRGAWDDGHSACSTIYIMLVPLSRSGVMELACKPSWQRSKYSRAAASGLKTSSNHDHQSELMMMSPST